MSEDKLRALFAEFKLQLLDELKNYVSTSAFNALEARVKTLELWQAGVLGQVAAKRQFSAATLAFAMLVVAAVTALGVFLGLHR